MNSQPSSHTAHSPASVSEYAERTSSHAEAAAVSVTDTFVHRILGVPGALIGSIQVPDPRPLSQRLNTWHYWWQAHLLECIIDAGQRHLREGRITEAQEQLHRARSLLRGINVRNLKTLEVNNAHYASLAAHLPNSVIKVAESGVAGIDDVRAYAGAGADAILIGEALVRSGNPEGTVREFSKVPVTR